MAMTTTLIEQDGATTITVATLCASVAMKDEYLGVGMIDGIQSGFDHLKDVARTLQT